MQKVDFRLFLITDRSQCHPRKLQEIIGESCNAGAKAIQLREKDLPLKSLYRLGKELKELCNATATKLLINERYDLALAIEADGVHLTSNSIPPKIVKHKLTSAQLLGVSTHSIDEAIDAEQADADYVLFGPVFPTPSKIKYGPAQGLKKLKEISMAISIPIFAVGGISPDNVRQCLDSGVHGVAVISSVMKAQNISQIISDFSKQLGGL